MTEKIPLVTVSMPYFGSPETVRRAVDAVLAQTMTDLRLVVVCDGARPLDPATARDVLGDITDPRLVVFRLDENRGRYFADAVTLTACESPWFASHDADDEADPRWLERMLDAGTMPTSGRLLDYVSTAQRVEGANGVFAVEKPKAGLPRQTLTHYAHMAGLWRTEWLRDVAGGPHPEFRVGYDTLLSMIARSWGEGVNLDEPLYTRYRRAGSLTTARQTGMRSRYRAEQRVRLTRLWEAVRDVEGTASTTPRDIIRREARDQWAAVDRYAERLLRDHGFDGREALADEIGGRRPVNPDSMDAARLALTAPRHPLAPLVEPPSLEIAAPEVLEGYVGRYTGMPWTTVAARWQTPWALGQATAAELDAFLRHERPMLITEYGSGVSTLVLAAYARESGATLHVFEHDRRYLDRTRAMLVDVGLWRDGMLHFAPLADGPDGPLYGGPIPANVDFVLIDGPPEKIGGRRGVVNDVVKRLKPTGRAWLDDAERPIEREAIDDWISLHDGRRNSVAIHEWGGRRVAELLMPEAGSTPIAPLPGPVIITLLAGGRPHLLERTIEGIRPMLDMQQIYLHVHLNQRDEQSRVIASRFLEPLLGRITVSFPSDDGVMPIGPAFSECAQVAADSGADFWLHLEDDWLVDTADRFWLHRAAGILDELDEVGQVRLRHSGERTLPYHMLTKRALLWRADLTLGALIAEEAHWTFNPSLVRTAEVASTFARAHLSGERHAQEITHSAGYRSVAQLHPGVFRHIGGGRESLADRTGGR